jgi:hypothetical protein
MGEFYGNIYRRTRPPRRPPCLDSGKTLAKEKGGNSRIALRAVVRISIREDVVLTGFWMPELGSR